MLYNTKHDTHTKYLTGIDSIVHDFLDDVSHEYAVNPRFITALNIPVAYAIKEFRFINISVPRRIGKSVYLTALANALAQPVDGPCYNVTLVRAETCSVGPTVNIVNTSHHLQEQLLINLNNFAHDIDVILFDDIKQPAIDRIIESDQVIRAATKSQRFAAISLRTET